MPENTCGTCGDKLTMIEMQYNELRRHDAPKICRDCSLYEQGLRKGSAPGVPPPRHSVRNLANRIDDIESKLPPSPMQEYFAEERQRKWDEEEMAAHATKLQKILDDLND